MLRGPDAPKAPGIYSVACSTSKATHSGWREEGGGSPSLAQLVWQIGLGFGGVCKSIVGDNSKHGKTQKLGSNILIQNTPLANYFKAMNVSNIMLSGSGGMLRPYLIHPKSLLIGSHLCSNLTTIFRHRETNICIDTNSKCTNNRTNAYIFSKEIATKVRQHLPSICPHKCLLKPDSNLESPETSIGESKGFQKLSDLTK